MTGFVLACLAMVAVAAVLFARPVFNSAYSLTREQRWLSIVLVTLVVTLMSGGVYITYLANHDWQWSADSSATQTSDKATKMMAVIRQLEAQASQNPNSLTAWIQLGTANAAASRFPAAIDAYQHAYDLTQGQDAGAITGLAEAMLLSGDRSLIPRAGELLNQALQQHPDNPKALWYGGLVAMNTDQLPLARDRFKSLLALNPPQKIQAMLERTLSDLDEQMNGKGQANNNSNSKNAAVADAASGRSITVKVKLASAMQAQLKQPLALFVLARDPTQGGPPLAVERHSSTELPLSVALTTADAMIPTHSIAAADTVEVVARLSNSGTAIQQSGDYVGTATYSFAKQGERGTVTIEIDHQVP